MCYLKGAFLCLCACFSWVLVRCQINAASWNYSPPPVSSQKSHDSKLRFFWPALYKMGVPQCSNLLFTRSVPRGTCGITQLPPFDPGHLTMWWTKLHLSYLINWPGSRTWLLSIHWMDFLSTWHWPVHPNHTNHLFSSERTPIAGNCVISRLVCPLA